MVPASTAVKEDIRLTNAQREKAPERNSEIKGSKVCINSGKKGHLAKDCWFKDSNKSRRPKDSSNQNREAAALPIISQEILQKIPYWEQ
jgi:hypothetical protein